MKLPISDLTYKIVALPNVLELRPEEFVEWAIEMIQLGHDTPNLLILAGFDEKTPYFEIKPYLEAAIHELGLQMKQGEVSLLCHSYYFAREISHGKRVRLNLSRLYELCTQVEHKDFLNDFYLLDCAWDQIDYDAAGYNHYWERVNKQNIEQVVIQVAKDWIAKYKKHCEHVAFLS